MTLLPGDLVAGKYRIIRRIGDGGMGSVYEARHELLGAPVALKFLHAELAQRPGLSARFLQEARVSATIQSPHVVRVTDVDTSQNGAPYLVMELLSGESLQKLLARFGRLDRDQAVDFALQILVGLEAAHGLGVVHRDLKPDNVLVVTTAQGPLLKLIDFGIAKLRQADESKPGLTRAGVVMGTAEYMAPEQLYSASQVDHRADLYSLGVMLFEMLSGRRPAEGDSPEAIVAKVLSGDVQKLRDWTSNPEPELEAVVERAGAADREKRFSSAREMRLGLSRCAGELSAAGRQALGSAEASLGGPSGSPTVAASPGSSPPADTVDEPRPGVRATLPPDVAGAAKKGATQAVPQLVPGIAHEPPRPRSRGRSSRAWFWVIGLSMLLLLAAAIAVIGGMRWTGQAARIADQPALPTPPTVPENVVEPIVIPTPSEVPVDNRTRAPTSPPPRGTRPPVATPAPPESSTAAPSPLPLPSFALPSTFPPLPSGFPAGLPSTLPSLFPQIPGLTLPGSDPAPTSSASGTVN